MGSRHPWVAVVWCGVVCLLTACLTVSPTPYETAHPFSIQPVSLV